jgi:predicted nucleotidyltransferase
MDDLPADAVRLIRDWAARTDSVREVWLFGSRAKGTSRPDSDIDIAIYLMPPTPTSDWALAAYTANGDAWQHELERLLGRHAGIATSGKAGTLDQAKAEFQRNWLAWAKLRDDVR